MNAQFRRAVVVLANGRSYLCDAYIKDGAVHARRVRRRIYRDLYQDVDDRAWSRNAWEEVRWLDS